MVLCKKNKKKNNFLMDYMNNMSLLVYLIDYCFFTPKLGAPLFVFGD